MTLTPKQRSIHLTEALNRLDQADALIQQALGACDESEEAHMRITDLYADILGQKMFVDADILGQKMFVDAEIRAAV
jgi:hypothetical protein